MVQNFQFFSTYYDLASSLQYAKNSSINLELKSLILGIIGRLGKFLHDEPANAMRFQSLRGYTKCYTKPVAEQTHYFGSIIRLNIIEIIVSNVITTISDNIMAP